MRESIKRLNKYLSAVSAVLLLTLVGCNKESVSSGKISIKSYPDQAEVYLNGTSVGETPLKLPQLNSGEYTVELRKEGYVRAYKTVALLEGREAQVDMQLMKVTGLLLVKSDPSGSEVIIDGEVRGSTPALITKLPLGSYDVTLRSVGLPEQTIPVELLDRKPVKIEVQHAPRVAVNSYPPGAEILVDGELKGLAPLVLENIPMGPHKIMAQLDQYDSQQQSIQLSSGLNDSVEFNLMKNSGTLVLDTEPALAQVFVSGTLFATTQPKEGTDSISQPLRIALKAGMDHQIQLVRNGYRSVSLNVQTEIDQVVTRHEILKRIFVYDTLITTDAEVIKCRMEYKLPNGNIYYERFPGVFDTAKAAEIRDVQPISLDDESNLEARRLIEMNKSPLSVE